MKKYIVFVIVSTFIAGLPALLMAQRATSTKGFNNNGTRVAQFLKIGVGGRAAAMGESFAAIANDATALYWNPGGIGNLQNLEVHLSHMDYLLDITFDYAALVVPTEAGNFGFSAALLGMGDEPRTTLSDPDGVSGVTWSASSFAVGFTFGRAMTDRFSFGVTAKYIQENILNSSASTLAIDIGSLFDTGIRGIKIGMAMTNFGGKMKMSGRDLIVKDVDVEPIIGGNFTPEGKLKTRGSPLPLNFRVGLSLEVFRTESSTLLMASDFNHPTDADERINVGAEYSFKNRVYLRGGYKFNYDEESFTAGGGINLPVTNFNVMIDYAFQDFGIFGETHRFSIGLKL